jgi:hypothetical protein
MKKIILPIILLLVVIISVGGLLVINHLQTSTQKTVVVTSKETILVTPTPIANTDIIAEMTAIMAVKYKKLIPEIILTVGNKDSSHAFGTLQFKGVTKAIIWFGARENGKWVLAYDDVGMMDCAIAEKYHFSNQMVPSCMKDRVLVQR